MSNTKVYSRVFSTIRSYIKHGKCSTLIMNKAHGSFDIWRKTKDVGRSFAIWLSDETFYGPECGKQNITWKVYRISFTFHIGIEDTSREYRESRWRRVYKTVGDRARVYLLWKMNRSSLSGLTTDEFLLFIEFRNVFVSLWWLYIIYNIHTYSIRLVITFKMSSWLLKYFIEAINYILHLYVKCRFHSFYK